MKYESIKISVVTVCYNSVSSIEDTIKSVINQTYPNIEYIIIDGGSTDRTVDILKKYSDRVTYWISEPDKGIYDAMNKGIDIATGDYLNFMNAGDTFFEDKVIEKVVPLFCNYDIISGIAATSLRNKLQFKFWKPIKKNFKFKDICAGGLVNHQATFIKRELLNEKYSLDYGIIADEIFFLNQVVFSDKIYKPVDIIISKYDVSGISSCKQSGLEIKQQREKFFRSRLPTCILRDYKASTISKIKKRIHHEFFFFRKYYNKLFINHPHMLLGE